MILINGVPQRSVDRSESRSGSPFLHPVHVPLPSSTLNLNLTDDPRLTGEKKKPQSLKQKRGRDRWRRRAYPILHPPSNFPSRVVHPWIARQRAPLSLKLEPDSRCPSFTRPDSAPPFVVEFFSVICHARVLSDAKVASGPTQEPDLPLPTSRQWVGMILNAADYKAHVSALADNAATSAIRPSIRFRSVRSIRRACGFLERGRKAQQ